MQAIRFSHRVGRPGRVRLLRGGTGLLLLLTLLLGARWQWYARAQQQLDVGGPLDDGYLLDFYAAEERGDGSGLTYRWSQPGSEIRLWAPTPGSQIILTLQMLAPPQPDGPQRVALAVAGAPLAEVPVTEAPRRYAFLLTAPEPLVEGDIPITLEASRLAVVGDPRSLGVALAHVTVEAVRGPPLLALLREFWAVPFLPLGLLLLGVGVIGLQLRFWLAGVVPAGALVGLALAGRWLPDARLVLAAHLVMAVLLMVAALGLLALLRRARPLWPDSDRRAWRWLVGIFLVALVTTFVPTVQSDGTGYYAYLRSFTMDGDLQFGNEYRDAPFRHGPDPNKRRDTATGHQANPFAVGPAIAWGPLYGVAHLLVRGGQALGVSWEADGYARPYLVLSMFTSALAGLVTLLVCYQICRRRVGPPVALLAVVTLFLGSNLLYYAMREGSFAHALSTAVTSLYLLAWLRLEERPTVGRWALLGAASGAMILMYWLSALLLLLPLLTFGRLLVAALRGPVHARREQMIRLMAGGALAAGLLLLVFSPQLLTWKVLYGTWVTVPQGTDYIEPRRLRLMDFLFSHLRGVLPWSPAFFFGMLGLPLLWGRNRWLTISLALAFLAYFLYNASHWQWYAGGAFGPRRITLLAPWFAIGLALLFARLRRWRAGLPVMLAALMIGWMTMLTIRYRLFLIPHDPGLIRKMPELSFYFSLEALPLWALPGWADRSFIVVQLQQLFRPGGTDALAVLLPVMALATWGVVALSHQLAKRERVD